MESPEEAKEAVRDFLERGTMGQAGMEIVLEEMMEGVECSVLALTDGARIAVLPPAQDHKRVNDGDEGPNTGGMGAFAPTPTVDAELLRVIQEQILKPTVDGMAKDGMPFMGCLFAGLMLTANGPRVIEFNCRFGDPECQPILMRMKGDLVDVLEAGIDGTLDTVDLSWDERATVCIVMASEGYPGSYPKGVEIMGLDDAAGMEDVFVFHAGTKLDDGKVVTSGGRVLGVTALGDGVEDAINRSYEAVKKISWPGVQFRTDIGKKALNR